MVIEGSDHPQFQNHAIQTVAMTSSDQTILIG